MEKECGYGKKLETLVKVGLRTIREVDKDDI
jgi:hypothetical protein